MRLFSARVMRFLMVGGFNTVSSYVLYVGFLQVFHYAIAYTLSFVISVIISYLLNTKFVFRGQYSWRRFFAFPSVYVTQYLLGLMLLHVFIRWMDLSPLIAPIIVAGLTWPISFLMSRFVITYSKQEKTA